MFSWCVYDTVHFKLNLWNVFWLSVSWSDVSGVQTGFSCVSVSREMLHFVSHRFGRILYLFISSDALCQCPAPFSIYNFCLFTRQKSAWWFLFFLFFLNKRHFWTSSPLNDYKWICLAGTTGSFYKIWQEISLTGICMAQFVLFVSSTQCPRVNRPIARHKEQGQNITSCQEEGGHFKHT